MNLSSFPRSEKDLQAVKLRGHGAHVQRHRTPADAAQLKHGHSTGVSAGGRLRNLKLNSRLWGNVGGMSVSFRLC